MINQNFWKNKKVLITGHTGFKGSWLSLWLLKMGAKVSGFALSPKTTPSLFEQLKLGSKLNSHFGDIRNYSELHRFLKETQPEIVIHMAAQPLVRYSYQNPIETYEVNVMGTVNLLEAIRQVSGVKSFVNVTTDKCYENKEWVYSYRENDRLGGYDPYSNSKACSELVTQSYRDSFFNIKKYSDHTCAIASARAGNVIGGGDWAVDRLIPDIIRARLTNQDVIIRNPRSIRPWQHVLEPLSGYLSLAEKLFLFGPDYSQAWNFAPEIESCKDVEWMAKSLLKLANYEHKLKVDDNYNGPHEANILRLDNSKAKNSIGWYPKWDINTTLCKTAEWYLSDDSKEKMCTKQIDEYEYNSSEMKNE